MIRCASLRWAVVIGLFSLLLTAAAPLALAGQFPGFGWTATWTASPQSSEPGLIPDLNNLTVRLIVHATVGGNQLRIRLSNAYGTQSLLIGDAHVAVSACALLPTIVPATDQALTFGGQSTITIPVGAVILSDPVNFSVTPLRLARFDRDVLSQAGVRCVIVEEGLNDVATAVILPNEATTASQIIWALTQLIQRGHDQGLTVFGVTLGPFAGSIFYSAAGETERQAVNQFIRTGHLYDGVLDFDQVLRDPSNPTQLLPAYDSGDHVPPQRCGLPGDRSINRFSPVPLFRSVSLKSV
jgi:hypothetical protein